MKYIKIIICIMIIFSVTINITTIFAAQQSSGGGSGTPASGNFFQDILDSGKKFFTPGTVPVISGSPTAPNIGTLISDAIKLNIIPVIETIGNLIFFVAAAFLGLKYIWSSVEGKSQIKETLPTFVVASCVFYLADTIYKFASGAIIDITSGTTYQSIQTNLWANISLVVNILAISGIMALGLKYMFSAADTKANIKKDLIPVAIGLVLIYSISSFLSLIVSVGKDII